MRGDSPEKKVAPRGNVEAGLVERLRKAVNEAAPDYWTRKLIGEAAAALEQMQERIAELEREIAELDRIGMEQESFCLYHDRALKEAQARIAELEGALREIRDCGDKSLGGLGCANVARAALRSDGE